MGCADGFAFSSGQAATVTMMHTLKAGDHVVSIDDVYAGTQQYFTYVPPEYCPRFCCGEVCVPAGVLLHRMCTVRAIGMGDVSLATLALPFPLSPSCAPRSTPLERVHACFDSRPCFSCASPLTRRCSSRLQCRSAQPCDLCLTHRSRVCVVVFVLCCSPPARLGLGFALLRRIATPMGLNFTFCDMSAPGALAAAIRPTTRLVWLETPTNPTMKITSIEVVAAAAHAVGAVLVVDNTFASPYLQSPLALGADVVFHSVSKYIGGHSDLVMGALVTSDAALATRLRHLQVNMGGVPSPFDCFLASRGMKTLGLRMAAHGANGAAVAAAVEAHPAVRRVLYPGLPSHPSYDIAVAQMRGGGGMMTFWLDGGLPAACAFLGALSVVTLAVSLGGVESLVEHPALMTHAALPPAVRAELGIDDGTLRKWRQVRWGTSLG